MDQSDPADHRWGLGLNDYLESIETYIPSRKPSYEQVLESYLMFHHGKLEPNITCNVLEDVLLLLHYPEAMVAWTTDPEIDHEIFDHYFGFLCVQLLVLGIQLDVLARQDMLEETVIFALPEDPGAVMVSHALHQESIKAMTRFDVQCGASQEELKDILDTLGEARRILFCVCRSIPDMHGWDTIFVAVWAAWKSSPELHRSSKYFIVWPLYELTCRCVLASPKGETPSVGALVAITEWATGGTPGTGIKFEDFDPLGFSDMHMLCEALTESLNQPSASRLHDSIVPILTRYVVRSLALSGQDFSDISGLLFQAAFHRLWLEIEDDRCLTDLEYRRTTLKLAVSLLNAIGYPFHAKFALGSEISKRTHMVAASAFFDQVLPHADWVDLAGRLLLLPGMSFCSREVSELELG
ncbi:unnamed protein product [Rhizoctonia solani]|uniref:Uncharacterized protein n=1 Tax=Rhizoctonia solani TaxID=456999 RepID=A0A8H3AQ87_9AGAM|nr:unnamed protein product [Rhizoctonia solani]